MDIYFTQMQLNLEEELKAEDVDNDEGNVAFWAYL